MHTQHIALALFLILVTVGVIVVLSISIVVKRRITRRKSRVERNTYTPCGHGLSKVWRENLERSINATVRVRTEPKAFGTEYESNFAQLSADNKMTFLYRAKAVDQFIYLKENILRLCPTLEAPPIRGIQAFLFTARDHAMNPPASRERIEEYCRLYLWARHDLEPFGAEEYNKLCEVQKVLMEHVQRAMVARESTGQTTTSGQFSRIHSTKTPTSSRSLPRQNSTFVNQSSVDVVFATPRISESRPDPARLERSKGGSKPSAASLTLKRRRGHELLVSTGDTPELIAMRGLKVGRGAYEKPLDERDANRTANIPVPSTTSRRASCQSDGSQTALINLDPVVAVTTAAKGLSQAARLLRPNEPFGSTETKPILPTGKEDPSESPKGGLENEGVNC